MSKQASEFQEKTMSRFFRGKEIFKPLPTEDKAQADYLPKVRKLQ